MTDRAIERPYGRSPHPLSPATMVRTRLPPLEADT